MAVHGHLRVPHPCCGSPGSGTSVISEHHLSVGQLATSAAVSARVSAGPVHLDSTRKVWDKSPCVDRDLSGAWVKIEAEVLGRNGSGLPDGLYERRSLVLL